MNTLLVYLLTCTSFLFSGGEDWANYYTTDEVTIQWKFAECQDNTNGIHQQKVLLKFINHTHNRLEVSFNYNNQYDNPKYNNSDTKIQKVVLTPNQTLTGDCSTRESYLYVFAKQLNLQSTELIHFDLKNITVNHIESAE